MRDGKDTPVPLELTVTAKGQVTLRKSVLRHLGVKPGDKIEIALLAGGRVELAHTEHHGQVFLTDAA